MVDTTKEQKILKQSIWMTTTLGVVGILFGLRVNSQSIAFEGFYSIIDALVTTTAFFVSKLIMAGGNRRFQYGYWHLEPLLAAFNGMLLASTCFYAFINGIYAWREGGHQLNFEYAFIYAVIASMISIVMLIYVHHASKTQRSEFLRIDAQGWLIGGALALALCVSFLIAMWLNHTRFEFFIYYADPFILIILSLLLIQIPLRTIWRAMQEVFIVTPIELDKKLHAVMNKISSRHTFITYKTYVAKIGRVHFIEINIVTHSDFAKEGVTTLDRIRQEISDQLADIFRHRWLTITFTANKKWL